MKNLYLPTTPALEAAYAVAPDPPLVAMRLETLMMQPGDGVSQLAQGTKGLEIMAYHEDGALHACIPAWWPSSWFQERRSVLVLMFS